jgi:flagellar FliJ protein
VSWTGSLIKLSGYNVEVLQKRLAEIVDRRAGAELRLLGLQAEGRVEAERARADAEAGWYHLGFIEGLRARQDAIRAEIAACLAEEAGARDALAEAFEEQKKYEQVAESARLTALRETARRETAVLDELGLRRAAGR